MRLFTWILPPPLTFMQHFRILTKVKHHLLSTKFIALIYYAHSPTSSIYSYTHPFIQQSFHPGEKKKNEHNEGSLAMSTSIVLLSKLVSGWEGKDLPADRIEIKVSMFYINIYDGKPVIETLSQKHTHHCTHTNTSSHLMHTTTLKLYLIFITHTSAHVITYIVGCNSTWLNLMWNIVNFPIWGWALCSFWNRNAFLELCDSYDIWRAQRAAENRKE